MFFIKLTDSDNGQKLLIDATSILWVGDYDSHRFVCTESACHKNRGFSVKESFDEICQMLNNVLEG